MDLNVNGNPGTGNSYSETKLDNVESYNPNATEVKHIHYERSTPTRMSTYFQNLLDEIRGNITDEVIDELLWYNTKLDGTKGMEEKLADGGFRSRSIEEAKYYKQLYAKKAMQYDCYPSAQKIILNLFARIKHEFYTSVFPLIEAEQPLNTVMQQIREKIVTPIMELIEANGAYDKHLNFTEDHIYGMIYYLTGMCHINWKDYDNV